MKEILKKHIRSREGISSYYGMRSKASWRIDNAEPYQRKNRQYVSFVDGNATRLAEADPALFFETYRYPILLDEFEKVPSILETIKDIVDKLGNDGKNNNGLF